MSIGCPGGGRSSVHRDEGVLLGRTVQSYSLQAALWTPILVGVDGRLGGTIDERQPDRGNKATLPGFRLAARSRSTLHLDGLGCKETGGGDRVKPQFPPACWSESAL